VIEKIFRPLKGFAPKSPEPAKDVSLGNEGNTTAFEQSAAEELSRAIQDDFEILNRSLAALAQIQDPELLQKEALKLEQRIKQLEKDMVHNPESAQAFYKILAAAFANGLAAKTKVNTQ
jgi:hypothetical protein